MRKQNIIPSDPIKNAREKELILVMQTSDNKAQIEKAFHELYEMRYKGVFNKLKVSLKNNVEDAEDVMQEAFVKAWTSIKTYNHSTTFSTWLYKIAHNTMIDHIRKQKYELIRVDGMTPSMNDGTESYKDRSFNIPDHNDKNGFDKMATKEYKELVHTAIAQIKNANMREIIRLKYIEQMSGEEIATRFNIPMGTYKASNHRAESLVKEYLLKRGFNPAPFSGQRKKKAELTEA